jgi:hypothetical protein
LVPHTKFKGRPEDANWNELYHTSLRNYAAISLQVPSILSILLGIYCKLGRGGGGQREGTVEGQQYTSIVPSSMGPTVHKLGQKYKP